jgi:LPXTG-motif cell wall-anchored protein
LVEIKNGYRVDTLRKKLLLIGFFMLLVYSNIALAQIEPETETIVSDNDILNGGYFVLYRRDISCYDTSVTVILSSSEPVEFGVCDDPDLEDWNNDEGPYPEWYYNAEDVLTRTMTFILDKGTYDFCLLNWGVNPASYTISVTITFDPSNTGGLNTIWYVVIAVVIIGGLIGIFLFRRSRRSKTQQPYSQPSTHDSRQIYTPYQPPSYTTQAPATITPTGTKVCQNCGADMESDVRFCTNCGSQI